MDGNFVLSPRQGESRLRGLSLSDGCEQPAVASQTGRVSPLHIVANAGTSSPNGRLLRVSPISSPRTTEASETKHIKLSSTSTGGVLSSSPLSPSSLALLSARVRTGASGNRGTSFTSGRSYGREPHQDKNAAKGNDNEQNSDREHDEDSDLDDDELISNVKMQRVASVPKRQDPAGMLRKRSATAPRIIPILPQGGAATSRRKKDTALRDVDETVFRFWMLVEDFKRHKDKQAKAYLAEILYSQYLAPSSESSNSPYYISALRMPPGIFENIERNLNASSDNILSRNLFDAAQAEVWRYLRKRPFPIFLKHICNAALFCSNSDALMASVSLREAGDAEKRKMLKQRGQLKLKIPDALFPLFVRFVTEEEWDLDEEALDEEDEVFSEYRADERVKITTTSLPEFPTPCYRGHSTLNVPPHKALDMISSVEERCRWDDMYSRGRVEEVLGEPNATLLRVETWLPPEKEGSSPVKCEQLILRTAKQLKDGTCIYLWRSVEHPEHLEKEGTPRIENYLSGFLLLPHSEEPKKKSTIYSLSMLDTKGAASPEVMRTVNLMQARLSYNINQYISSVEKGCMRLALTKLTPPVLLLACYDCNCSWNPWQEEQEEKDDREYLIPRLTCKEGETIILLEQAADTSNWIGYSFNNVRGLFDASYFRYSEESAINANKSTTKASDRPTWNPHYLPLIELLSRQDLHIITALCAATDTQVAERAAHAFLCVLRVSPGRTIPLLVTLIANEVRKTGIIQGSTLFRGNDIASHLLSAYCQLVGRKYLKKVVRPLVEKVFNIYAQNKSMEIDPARLTPGENAEENVHTLTDFCNYFLNAITSSLKYCPRSFRVICHYLQREVSKKFPHSKYIVLAGFFFLRFISPSVVSPEAFGLTCDQVSPKCRRGLVLVSKVIQNLANGVLFGEKEAHMCLLNPFIQSNLTRFEAFFEEIVNSSGNEDLQERQISYEEAYPSACYLHAAICRNLNSIATKIAMMERVKKATTSSQHGSEFSLFFRLLEVLLECGPPPVEYNAQDPREHIMHDKKLFVSKKSRGSARSRRKEKNKERTEIKGVFITSNSPTKDKEKGEVKEKSKLEREKERISRDREQEIERMRADRSQKLGKDQARPSQRSGRSSSDRDLRSASLTSKSSSFREYSSIQPLALASLRIPSGMETATTVEPSLDYCNSDNPKDKEKEKSVAFLKISMIKKGGLIDRLNNKIKNTGKDSKDNSTIISSLSQSSATLSTRIKDYEDDNHSSSESNHESDDEEITENGNGNPEDRKQRRLIRRSKDDKPASEKASAMFLPSPSGKSGAITPRRTASGRLASLRRTRSSGKERERDKDREREKEKEKDRDKSLTTKATTSRKPTSTTNPMLQVINSHELGVDPGVTMALLSKQLETLHEERVRAFREVETLFMAQTKLSLATGISSSSTQLTTASSPRHDFSAQMAMLSPRTTERQPTMTPSIMSPTSSPFVSVEEFRKLVSVFEDKVRQEERLIQAVVLLSSLPTSSNAASLSPIASSTSNLSTSWVSSHSAEFSSSPPGC